MMNILKAFVMVIAILTTACATASAATNICGKPTTFVRIEQDHYDPPMWKMPDTGREAGPNGETLPNTWEDLHDEGAKSLTLHCYFDGAGKQSTTLDISSSKTCTWTADGTMTCK